MIVKAHVLGLAKVLAVAHAKVLAAKNVLQPAIECVIQLVEVLAEELAENIVQVAAMLRAMELVHIQVEQN